MAFVAPAQGSIKSGFGQKNEINRLTKENRGCFFKPLFSLNL
jgi:hypothetical protein